MSTRNPFRSQAKSPETAAPSERPSSPPLPPLPPPSTTVIDPSPASSSSHAPAAASSDVDGTVSPSAAPKTDRIDEDLPPAYTPAADPTIGEATIQLGPRRPFQEPPRHPPPSQYAPSGPESHTQQQSQWHQPLGQSYHPQTQPSWQPQSQSGWRPQLQPSQAQWQTRGYPNSYGGQRQGGGGLLGSLFDTVRDVVDVVSGAHEERVIAAQRANAGAYAAPHSPSSGMNLYAPPAGPPPRGPGQTPRSGRRSSTPPRSPPPIIPDDGTPTRTPVPGHPLLRDGNLIVYPKDHLCVKCRNTGYQNYDPSHPCRKCWEKYGKPYTGALAYTTWSSSGNDPRMQRALPKFIPPHLAESSPPPGLSPRGTLGRGFASTSQQPQFQPSRSVSQPHLPMHPQPTGPSYYVVNPLFSMNSRLPVPHAIPVSPGDQRLGGRLCTRCGGDGMRSMFLIDMTTCESCGGTGRVWS
ncbi:hypothetical protein PAXRUDRAFT_826974 [Paxillus rubicundulus Ve08.2h10]|uniref:Uncharacterized protein n=1 Tax=Paxillus rubicundulus Ve08.2h10 TaxID=930991 RepID=A0A0D0E3M2_9AGAM|nr:hypothetical protein PAXRUDRAFT_826974 [Paxillus rubicundulus Ve08.2h10]